VAVHGYDWSVAVAYPEIFFGWGGGGFRQEFFFGGGSTNSVEDRGQRERRSGGGSPLVRVPLNLQMRETRILIRLLRTYFPRISEFGPASEFRGGNEPLNPPRYATGQCWYAYLPVNFDGQVIGLDLALN
jgi:hypothetical protein